MDAHTLKVSFLGLIPSTACFLCQPDCMLVPLRTGLGCRWVLAWSSVLQR